jgi:hypothetical protein
MLTRQIQECGGEPSSSSGAWGAFTRQARRGADSLGNRAVLAMLEEAEELSHKRYARELSALDEATRLFVRYMLAPEQRKAHELARALLRYVKAA